MGNKYCPVILKYNLINPQLYCPLKYTFPISFSFRRKSPKGDRGMVRAGGEVIFQEE